MNILSAWICGSLVLGVSGLAARAADEPGPLVLRGPDAVEAVFGRTGYGYGWVAYRDVAAKREWRLGGPRLTLAVAGGARASVGETGFSRMKAEAGQITFEQTLPGLALEVRQVFSFCADGRTLRMKAFLRATGGPVVVRETGLLELEVAGQEFRLMGPDFVSSPVFGDGVFAGAEHPSALCRAQGNTLALAQHPCLTVGGDWVGLPAAVFGSSSEADRELAGAEALRRAFLRYLETVWVKPKAIHLHYNDWWTAPVPSSEQFVLQNLAELKKGLYESAGAFFNSYALDAGWSNPKSAWEIDTNHFPQRFAPICAVLEGMGSHAGLWVSPSSLYPFALDNHWLASAGYEVTPCGGIGLSACLAKGGKYQTAFKQAALGYAREARLAHMKFDGFIPRCDETGHGHPPGLDSCLPIAEGLMEVFDALRALNPDIALEPTCFGYQPSPWWLMHAPFIIGPFGDDAPYGRCPAPDYLESMTTAREIKNLRGRAAFLMPNAALECFDIIVQCPGAFQNHAAMAIGRGRWFISSYINPKFMDGEAWRFFGDLVKWARNNRPFLREPLPLGGDPEKRQAYGYAYLGEARQLYCLRNPWMVEASLPLLKPFASARNLEVRMLYPRRGLIARLAPNAPLPAATLGPYETQFVEIVPTDQPPLSPEPRPAPQVLWQPAGEPRLEPVPGPSPATTSTGAVRQERARLEAAGRLELGNTSDAQLCVLCEGDARVGGNSCRITIDGREAPVSISKTEGAFGAAGEGHLEHWIWFLAGVEPGTHEIRIQVDGFVSHPPIGMYLRGEMAAPPPPAPFDDSPAFPLYRPLRVSWSRVLLPLAAAKH